MERSCSRLFSFFFSFLDFDPEALEEENWAGGGSDEDEEDGGSEEEEGHDGREHYVAVGYACTGYQFHWVVSTADENEKKNSKSKLRKGQTVLLDPKYDGARVSRDKLYYDEDENAGSESGSEEQHGENSDDESTVEFDSEADVREGTPKPGEDDEIESDDALGSEEERFSSFKFRGSLDTVKLNGAVNSDGEGSDNESEEHEEGSDGDDTENDEDNKDDHDEDDEDEDDGEEEEDKNEIGEDEELARRDQLRKMMAEEQK